MTNGTERALTVDLLTGQNYGLGDILEINRDFIELWDKYEKSETTGEVLSCQDKQNNIWLGEGASVWDYDYSDK